MFLSIILNQFSNIAQTDAFVKLTVKLLNMKNCEQSPAGQAYFISDGTPIDNFEFFRPLCSARGAEFPSLLLPVLPFVYLGWILEQVYHATNFLGLPIEPFLTRAEVFKVGVTHYFSIDKAKQDFGYVPLFGSKEGADRVAKYYRDNIDNVNFFRPAGLLWWFLINLGMGLLTIVAFDLVDTTNHWLMAPVYRLGILLFRSRLGLQIVFALAVLAHVIEAAMALYVAAALGCTNTLWLWGLQTVILGYPSLRLLHDRQEFMTSIRNEKVN